MPRPPRLLLSQTYYHIMTRGNNRHVVFKSDDDYQYFLQLIAKYKAEQPFDLYHYCLMPNHTHMLVKTNRATDFSNFMKRLNLAYFHHYRQNYGWIGHFWQDRFKSQPVGKDEYFIQCGKYIELNPVRKRLTERPEDYLYSSYRSYVENINDPLLTKDFLYETLGRCAKEKQKAYQGLVVDDIIFGSYKKNIWGLPDERYKETQKIQRHFH